MSMRPRSPLATPKTLAVSLGRRSAAGLLALSLMSVAACAKLTEPPTEEAIVKEEPKPVEKAPEPKPTAEAEPKPAAEPAPSAPAPEAKLGIKDLVVGKGAEAKSGNTVRVHYVGKLTDGTEFDASRKHDDKGFSFTLGRGDVIKGWDQGVAGMKVGGKRQLTIPPELGYGARGAGGVIPPNATLKFDVELLEVKGQ